VGQKHKAIRDFEERNAQKMMEMQSRRDDNFNPHEKRKYTYSSANEMTGIGSILTTTEAEERDNHFENIGRAQSRHH
jgi:DNA-binding transcriptional regulator WhiA